MEGNELHDRFARPWKRGFTVYFFPGPVFVAVPQYLQSVFSPDKFSEPRSRKVNKVFLHDPVSFSSHVDAHDVLALPEGVVLLLFGRVQQQVQLGDGESAIGFA
jgi:hypothetical protein